MARETKEITTPGNHKVVLKTYLTGGESKQIRGIVFSELKMNVGTGSDEKPTVKEVPADFIIKQEEKSVDLLVVSVDEQTENVRALLEELPAADYDFVLAEINKIKTPFLAGS